MNLRPPTLAAVAVVLSAPAVAAPPPPPPANYTASWRAIEALAPFQGYWTGEEVQHTGSGDLTRRAYRVVKRLGGHDVVLMEQGVSSSSDGKALSEAFNIITFDVKARRYAAYLPGYRPFTGDDDTSQLVAVERPDARTIIWSANLGDGARCRVTVVVTGEDWRERIERVSADGKVRVLSDLDLKRAPAGSAP